MKSGLLISVHLLHNIREYFVACLVEELDSEVGGVGDDGFASVVEDHGGLCLHAVELKVDIKEFIFEILDRERKHEQDHILNNHVVVRQRIEHNDQKV